MLGGWLSDCLRYDTEHDLDNFLKNRAFNGKPSTSIHLVSGFCQVHSDFKEFESCFSVSDSKSNFNASKSKAERGSVWNSVKQQA